MTEILAHHERLLLADYQTFLRAYALVDSQRFALGSPIEAMLLTALRHVSMTSQLIGINVGPRDGLADCHFGERVAWVTLQAQFDSYRVDFAVDCRYGAHTHLIIVECDGEQWHAANPEQVRRDKARDRYFAERGWPVMRFTGPEIYRDPLACARQIDDAVRAFVNRHRGEEAT